MKIEKIKIKNFRLLKDSVLEMKDGLSLLIGRNNSGKTSLLVLFEKFYNNENFTYDDFSISLRQQIDNIDINTNILDLSIQMILEIKYDSSEILEAFHTIKEQYRQIFLISHEMEIKEMFERVVEV